MKIGWNVLAAASLVAIQMAALWSASTVFVTTEGEWDNLYIWSVNNWIQAFVAVCGGGLVNVVFAYNIRHRQRSVPDPLSKGN